MKSPGLDLTLVGHDGVAVAASNWDQPTSNVGENYSYRPYYRQALAQGRGRFYGIGMTTGVPGYYLRRPSRLTASGSAWW